jgi:hypothetical protein
MLNLLGTCVLVLRFTRVTLLYFLLSLSFFFWWDWSLNSGLHACTVGTVQLEPHLQVIFLWLFWKMGSVGGGDSRELFA